MLRRTTIVIGFAAVAPLIVLAAMMGAGNLTAVQERAISERLSLAREVNAHIDNELIAGQTALSVLAGSSAFAERDFARARARVQAVASAHRDWRNVILTDLRSGQEVWTLTEAQTSRRSERPSVAAYLRGDRALAIGDITGSAPDCPCVSIHQPIQIDDQARYLLSVELDVADMQQALMADVSPPDIGAVVDRQGNFIARTLDYQEKLGQPATQYVRSAIAEAPSGVYEGVTYEGLRNRTAYVTSPLSGFSTHIAIPRVGLSALAAGSAGLGFLALLVALLTAALGIVYAVREQARWRAVERTRARSQKFEAIGQLASGVAHDFNNFLTIILASTRKLEREASPGQLENIHHIRSAAERGAALVKQLMSFTRDKPIALERVDLGETLASIEALLAQTLGATIDLTIEVALGACVTTNRAQLESALVNLAANARDAMPDGGAFSIRGKASTRANCFDIVVADTGLGMSEAVLQRALDPFFTTKGANGSGIGLAQVQALMVQSSGSIDIESAPGQGATIRLTLPSCPLADEHALDLHH